MDDKDPCSLLPKSTWSRFFIEGPGERKDSESFNSPKCFYSTNRGPLSVTLVITEGIEAWEEGSRLAQPREMPAIADFRTIALQLPNSDVGCSVAVDVANGQYLLTHVVPTYKAEELPDKCEFAHQLAESAMNTLVA